MDYKIEKQPKKFFIGYKLRTTNEQNKSQKEIPAHTAAFFQNNILQKIPNKLNHQILALYTEYENDYTKPYSYIMGCEVSSLKNIPQGLVGIEVPASSYAVFTTKGSFPESLIKEWQKIWTAKIDRSYTTDFELYREDFNPQTSPEVKIYISVK